MTKRATCCCSGESTETASRASCAEETIDTPVGPIQRVCGDLDFRDRLGAIRVRMAIARCCYRVQPGLYALGSPDAGSPVFASANYKLSFDCLRSALRGRSGWILVLDTDGVNVWCAAGKGTFGTDELVHRIEATGLARVVDHRRVIVPQLGAVGVASRLVTDASGFTVVYGPVRAIDLPAFLDAGEATAEMRRVRFGLRDRAVAISTELVMWGMVVLPVAVLLVLASQPFLAGGLIAAFLAGTVLAPLLLPWLPGKSFAVKGMLLGLLLGVPGGWATVRAVGPAAATGLVVLTVSITSFFALNFTGCTTFTSLSGTRYETFRAVPLQILGALVGFGLWCWPV